MDADIAELFLHPSCRGRARPRPSAALLELTRRHGVLQPVLVRALASGPRRFEILSHGDVWLAAQASGLYRVPIEVLEDIDDGTALEIIGATERRPRPLDAARRYRRLFDVEVALRSWGAGARVARQCRVTRLQVVRGLRVLSLPALLLEAVDRGALTFSHGYALLACRSEHKRLALGTRAIGERLSVRALERLVRAANDPSPAVAARVAPEPAIARSPDVVRLERQLTEQLGSPVTLDEQNGTLTIDYRGSNDVLDGLLDRFGVALA